MRRQLPSMKIRSLEMEVNELTATAANARAETEKFSARAKEAEAALKLTEDARDNNYHGRLKAEKERDTLRERLDDLKEKYGETTSALDRLTGYLDRVYEDDVVREDVIETESDKAPGKRLHPKRPQPLRPLGRDRGVYGRHQGADFGSIESAGYGNKHNLPHWSRY